MRSVHYFYKIVDITLALFFLLFGAMLCTLPFSKALQNELIGLVQGVYTPLIYGLFSFLIGGVLLANLKQGNYYHIKTGSRKVSMSTSLVEETVKRHLKTLFANQEIPVEVNLKKKRFHLTIDLPQMAFEEQRDFLTRLEEDLSNLFERHFGYRKSFLLSARFKSS